MSMFIYPYKMGSKSVEALSLALEARIIRLENSKFKGSDKKFVINWGNSVTNEEIEKANVLNKPEAVALATNKLTFFDKVSGIVSIPQYTIHREVAEVWVNEGKKVVVREKLNGHSGEGIVLFDNQSAWSEYNHSRAKLYVLYIPKKDEYRVHVVNGEPIDIQRKAIQPGLTREQVNFSIRNHHNGFIYVREGVADSCPSHVVEQAILAVNTVGLHFGAVDVIWNEYRKQGVVLEVNTAPGLEGQSVANYSKALKKAAYSIDWGILAAETESQPVRTIDLAQWTNNSIPRTRPVRISPDWGSMAEELQ